MTHELFRSGGPHKIRKTGPDEYTIQVKIPTDEAGMTARECTDEGCSPGAFKIKIGTGLTGEQTESYCPYCRAVADPSDFATREQIRYAKDIAMNEASDGIDRMVKDAGNLEAQVIAYAFDWKVSARNHFRRFAHSLPTLDLHLEDDAGALLLGIQNLDLAIDPDVVLVFLVAQNPVWQRAQLSHKDALGPSCNLTGRHDRASVLSKQSGPSELMGGATKPIRSFYPGWTACDA